MWIFQLCWFCNFKSYFIVWNVKLYEFALNYFCCFLHLIILTLSSPNAKSHELPRPVVTFWPPFHILPLQPRTWLSHGASCFNRYGGIWLLRAALFATRRHRGRVFWGRGSPPPKACPLIQKGTVVSGSPVVTDIATPSALKTRCLQWAMVTRHLMVVFEYPPNSLPCRQCYTPQFRVNIKWHLLLAMHSSSQTIHGRAMNGGNLVQ